MPSGTIEFQELCIEKNTSAPTRAAHSCLSGKCRMFRLILRSGDLRSEVPDVPWRHRRTKPRDGQDDEYQADRRSVHQGSHRGPDVYRREDGKGKMKPVTGLTDAQIKDAVAFYRGLN